MKLKDLYPAVITIVLIGIVLGIGIYVLEQLGDNLATTVGTVLNETGLGINSTISTVDKASTAGFHAFSLTACWANCTGVGTFGSANKTIDSGNWTTVSDAGTIINATSLNYNDVKCSYTYLYGTESSAVVDTTSSGIGDFADWITIIVVVIAAAIVLGIVLNSFGRKKHPSV